MFDKKSGVQTPPPPPDLPLSTCKVLCMCALVTINHGSVVMRAMLHTFIGTVVPYFFAIDPFLSDCNGRNCLHYAFIRNGNGNLVGKLLGR